MNTETSRADRLKTIDALRGVAALAVCLFHFRRDNVLSLPTLYDVVAFGHLGVEVFFVVSGFVIPLMLHKLSYTYRQLPAFLGARLFRLYPVYLGACALSIGLWFLSAQVPGFRGHDHGFNATDIACNLVLACNTTGGKWLIPVAWTLAIEAQYYVAIALSFPLLFGKRSILLVILLIWIILPVTGEHILQMFAWSALFAMGILCFLKHAAVIGAQFFWFAMALALVSHSINAQVAGGVAGIATVLAILHAPQVRMRLLVWLGTISYSLYLLHLIIGGRVVNLAVRAPDQPIVQATIFVLAVVLSIAASAIFYTTVEKSAHNVSRYVYRLLAVFKVIGRK